MVEEELEELRAYLDRELGNVDCIDWQSVVEYAHTEVNRILLENF